MGVIWIGRSASPQCSQIKSMGINLRGPDLLNKKRPGKSSPGIVKAGAYISTQWPFPFCAMTGVITKRDSRSKVRVGRKKERNLGVTTCG